MFYIKSEYLTVLVNFNWVYVNQREIDMKETTAWMQTNDLVKIKIKNKSNDDELSCNSNIVENWYSYFLKKRYKYLNTTVHSLFLKEQYKYLNT